MKPEKPKKLMVLSTVSLTFFALFLVIALGFVSSYQSSFRQKDVSFLLEESGKVILSSKKASSLPKGEHSLLLKNRESESVTFVLYQKGEKKQELTLSPKEAKKVSLASDGSKLSLLAKKKGASVAYLTDGESFRAVAKAMPEGGDLVFLSETKLVNESLASAFRLFGNFSFQSLSVESEGEGKIAVCPNGKFKGVLYVWAPDSEIFLKNFTPSYSKDERNFYLKAKNVNEEALDLSDYPVSSFDQLVRLASDEQMPYVKDEAEIRFIKSFAMEDSLTVSALAKLEFTAPVTFGTETLTFVSDAEGVYEVSSSYGCGIGGASLLFQSPKSDLVWTGDGSIPASSTIAKGSNLKTYNGSRLLLGGEGEAIPELTLFSDGPDYIAEDVVFSVEGNLLTASLPYLMDADALNEANFALSCKDGTATLEGTISGGVIVTRDSNGKERRFGIDAKRDPYQIPVVHLETEDGVEITSKTQYVSGTFTLDGSTTEYDSLSETHIRIRGRGNSTWKWEKKPYKIHFDEPTSILGLPAAEEWALFSNYADKSLMRNRLAQVMASELSFAYCPTQVCVDVFLNGDYLGVYTLGEHLEAGEGRVEVNCDMSKTDCGYFLEAGGVDSSVDVKGMNYFHAGLVEFVLIKTPEYNALTSEQFEYIHQYMLRADEAVKSGEGYEEYLDVDSVIDWLIMIELSCNTDCGWRRSTYFTKQPGEKLVMGPVWDFDLAFGNFSKDNEGDNTWVSSEPEDDYVGETWTTHLLEDPEFRAKFKARWLSVRDTLVDTALEEINRQYELNLNSADQNFRRWDILGKKVAFERYDTEDYLTYASQIEYLKDFITTRAAWIDEQVESF